ncbi:hypothetical protein BDV38DRAFT_280243 [Aspergillus pseudotamarii]|uniref:Uncharacterized protein n=1 Tax=Aspergillus pseudotamarii TaxID=132259 RepID=A0A5N6T1S5_ASPPS|nr:uncharacterized protein BDV38DRAFT_280243 [Aspergillus pseudotamarii]KAE8140247.1 hypothetical protein BDV38DRAFT_280243 [Aspergillus pseudotamarii]
MDYNKKRDLDLEVFINHGRGSSQIFEVSPWLSSTETRSLPVFRNLQFKKFLVEFSKLSCFLKGVNTRRGRRLLLQPHQPVNNPSLAPSAYLYPLSLQDLLGSTSYPYNARQTRYSCYRSPQKYLV